MISRALNISETAARSKIQEPRGKMVYTWDLRFNAIDVSNFNESGFQTYMKTEHNLSKFLDMCYCYPNVRYLDAAPYEKK